MLVTTAQILTTPIATFKPVTLLSFEKVGEGILPEDWKVDVTGPEMSQRVWLVREDPTAPSGRHVLTLTECNKCNRTTFHLCWTDKIKFLNGMVEVKLKPIEGSIEPGGGLIWRVISPNTYYLASINVSEKELRIYYVKEGRRVQLGSALANVRLNDWHLLRIEHYEAQINCYLNGTLLISTRDATINRAGGIGVWVRADAVTAFDDFAAFVSQ